MAEVAGFFSCDFDGGFLGYGIRDLSRGDPSSGDLSSGDLSSGDLSREHLRNGTIIDLALHRIFGVLLAYVNGSSFSNGKIRYSMISHLHALQVTRRVVFAYIVGLLFCWNLYCWNICR